VGHALYPLLSGFQEIGDHALQTVWQIEDDAGLDCIILDFGIRLLVVFAAPDDDTIDFQFADPTSLPSDSIETSHLSPWKDFIGVGFGWGWVTVNQQGYCDGMLLSFGGIFPQVVLSVIASSIKIGQVSKVSGLK
jgi:hypothetical protein